jgi:outer membrane protein, heavy metal efflux system
MRFLSLVVLLSIVVPLPARGDDDPELTSLIAEAVEQSPEIRAAQATAAAVEARVRPAGALPDPMVSLSYENDGVSPSLGTMEMTRLQFMAQQAIPFPGKLRLAKEVARKDAERAGTTPQRTALTIAASVRRAYADLLEAREGLRLIDEQADTWKSIEDVTRVRYAAGLASQQDVLRSQSERTRLLQQRQSAEAAERTSLSELRQLLFRSPDSPIPTEQRLVPGRLAPVPPREQTLARALDETPELKEIALAKERSKLSADLARRNLKPDFVASAGYMNRGGLPLMWAAGVGVSIPLWAGQKQRPLIVEAESLASSAAATEESLRRRPRAGRGRGRSNDTASHDPSDVRGRQES